MVNSFMNKIFVKLLCDVECEWTGKPPRYRAYVDDELFTERTWIWENVYLEEAFQIEAFPGKYTIRYELVDTKNATLRARNFRVEVGPAIVSTGGVLEVYENS
jgi:hypothetical protein